MKVRNNYTTHLGLGGLRILPDETAELPKGYGENHPVVKYYMSRGWLIVAGKNTENGNENPDESDENRGENNGGAASVHAEDLNAAVNVDGNENEGENMSGSGADSPSPENKSIDRMNKDELQALACERGIPFVEADTRQALIDKIKAARNADA